MSNQDEIEKRLETLFPGIKEGGYSLGDLKPRGREVDPSAGFRLPRPGGIRPFRRKKHFNPVTRGNVSGSPHATLERINSISRQRGAARLEMETEQNEEDKLRATLAELYGVEPHKFKDAPKGMLPQLFGIMDRRNKEAEADREDDLEYESMRRVAVDRYPHLKDMLPSGGNLRMVREAMAIADQKKARADQGYAEFSEKTTMDRVQEQVGQGNWQGAIEAALPMMRPQSAASFIEGQQKMEQGQQQRDEADRAKRQQAVLKQLQGLHKFGTGFTSKAIDPFIKLAEPADEPKPLGEKAWMPAAQVEWELNDPTTTDARKTILRAQKALLEGEHRELRNLNRSKVHGLRNAIRAAIREGNLARQASGSEFVSPQAIQDVIVSALESVGSIGKVDVAIANIDALNAAQEALAGGGAPAGTLAKKDKSLTLENIMGQNVDLEDKDLAEKIDKAADMISERLSHMVAQMLNIGG